MLWVDKHRPASLEKLSFHDDLTARLTNLGEQGDIPHLLFYGPNGAGKKTRIVALLRSLFGPGAEKQRLERGAGVRNLAGRWRRRGTGARSRRSPRPGRAAAAVGAAAGRSRSGRRGAEAREAERAAREYDVVLSISRSTFYGSLAHVPLRAHRGARGGHGRRGRVSILYLFACWWVVTRNEL